MRLTISTALTGLLTLPAAANDATISIDIPRLTVAEYHRPYVAFWIESADGNKIANLAVWYDVKQKDNEGVKWLKDMRQWWRRTGRELTMPTDGLSSPTRAPGTHQLTFDTKAKQLAELPAGDYHLIVEAAREVGGRELLRIPFQWPPKAPQKLEAKGEHEIGALSFTLTP
ncbi:hypothetical protein X566_02330 [Afipia sp. P52-10]|jgi:hypothetical protein|uniref:DUF2271 domain-containing protein n=1 Tax=Afipia sp. P52-10 TaxID=1429916 RepID=UPI0003DF28A2|nr:DUF2271 domain-containing protein [Afipia sp. P52-10]ETR76598.1 hypothetical protein X566_02330 [Afipia sp. P52-10]